MPVSAEKIAAARAAGYTDEEIAAFLQSVGNGRNNYQEVGRQAGLTARHVVEGALQLPATLANLPGMAANAGLSLVGSDFRFPEQNTAVSAALDQVGLPRPETPTERVVGDVSRAVVGAGTLAAGGGAVQAPGVLGRTTAAMAANPGTQLGGAIGAGAGLGVTREAGGGPLAQFAAALAGGALGAYGVGAADRAASQVSGVLRRAFSPQELEQNVRLTLERSGINWQTLSESARRQMLEDARRAVAEGRPLDPEALRRLADYRAIGATPLTGDITQNPTLITQQRNLAKTQANMVAPPGPNLPQIQNDNARRVIATLDDVAQSADDAYATGQRIIDRVQSIDDTINTAKNARYTAAREAAGQDIPVNAAPFVNAARAELDRQLKGKWLPAEISTILDDLATGRMTLDVRTMDVLKTTLATAQRSATDGNVRSALGIVRNALDNTDLQPQMPQFGGTQVVTGQQAQAINEAAQAPAEALRLLDRARTLAASQFRWRESLPFIEDAIGGATPDKFVQKHVINGSVDNLRGILRISGSDPALRDSVRAQLVGYIRQRGGLDADVTKFSSAGLEKGLEAIGRRKLELFFSPEEVNRIESAIRVAKYSQSQPIGSAVNNSNSGAMVIGKVLDGLLGFSRNVPLVGDSINAVNVWMGTRNAANVGAVLGATPPSVGVPASGPVSALPALSRQTGVLAIEGSTNTRPRKQ